MNMSSNNASKKESEISPQIAKVAMSAYFTDREMEYTEHVFNELRNVDWLKRLISKIEANGGIPQRNITNISLLFELRYAYELHRRNIQAQYEYKAGVGDSSVDFRCTGGKGEWLIELVSVLPSDAGKQSIHELNPDGRKLPKGIKVFEQTFDSNAENPENSEEGENILVQQKIGEKIFFNNQLIKFPVPSNAFHMIIVDMRGMLGMGGGRSLTHDDYLEIAYGSKRTAQSEILSHRWPPPNGKPIYGLFEKFNPLQSVKYIQERIHFIDFVCEKKYEAGEIIRNTFWVENLSLFPNKNEAAKMRSSHPLFYKEI